MDLRRAEEAFFKGLMLASTALVLGSLALILGVILWKGLPALSLDMLTQTPKGGYYLGKEGGILNAILGSLWLILGATALALCISLPVVLYLNNWRSPRSRLATLTRLSFDVLWGIPSIVYGAFGFTLMLLLGLRASLLAGIIAIALLMLPILSRSIDEVMRMVPGELLEASYALGATRWETAIKVMVRQALPGLVTAVLLAMGRGIGDAAAVLFTAGFTDSLPRSLMEPVATLPLAIFFQLGTPFPAVQQRAYASALILTAVVLVISLACRLLTRRLVRNVVR